MVIGSNAVSAIEYVSVPKQFVGRCLVDVPDYAPYPIAVVAGEMMLAIGYEKGERKHPLYVRRPQSDDGRYRFPHQPDFTYLIQCETTGFVKIGRATAPPVRVRDIQAMSPTTLHLVAILAGGNIEKNLHGLCFDGHVHGEWFKVSDTRLIQVLLHEAAQFTQRLVLSRAFYTANERQIDWLHARPFKREF